MKILVVPREDNNPYQALLYDEMGSFGVEVRYLGKLTRSYTLNLLLMPLELLARRASRLRLVHLHWTYDFGIYYGLSRFPFVRRVAQAWFYVWLWMLKLLGVRLVWTAHNVLPAVQVFADDLQVRRRLVSQADLVIAHSRSTLNGLAALGIVPRRSAVIPHGPYTVARGAESLRAPGAELGRRKFLFFGMVSAYKGIDTLLAAFAELPVGLDAELAVVGKCPDPTLRASLAKLAIRSSRPVTLRFEYVPQPDVSSLLTEADAVVLPYRNVTTSGSALLALSHGRPLIVPDLPGLAELPSDGIIRYNGTVEGLTGALVELIRADASVFAKMSAAGCAYCASISWRSIAKVTFEEVDRILNPKRAVT